MLSKFSRGLINFSYLYKPVSKTTNSIYNCTNFKVAFERNFHSNKYVWGKVSPKPNSKHNQQHQQKKSKDIFAQSIGYYSMAVVVLCGGLTFAAVPLYRLFCQVKINCHIISGDAFIYRFNIYRQLAMAEQ